MKDKLITLCIVLFLVAGLYFSVKTTSTLQSINQRLDRQNMEYQIVLEDDSIIVFDKNRFVGKVKCQGQLNSLMIEDNR
jgi:hypothetical protein